MLSTVETSGVILPKLPLAVATHRASPSPPPPGLADYLRSGCSLLPPPPPPSLEEQWAAQLKHLASQHPHSVYNRSKFIGRGTQPPGTYIPLSIHAPAHVKQLQQLQAEYSTAQHWWPASKAARKAVTPATSAPTVTLGPDGVTTSAPVDLTAELAAAMQEPLQAASVLKLAPTLSAAIRTSDSHPIHVSMLVPPELLADVSARMRRLTAPAPTLFDLPSDSTLDRLLWAPAPTPTRVVAATPTTSASPRAERRSSLDKATEIAIRDARTRRFSNDPEKPERPALAAPSPASIPLPPSPVPPATQLGNLLLSSCPGKKVRLDGPVRGRGGVCRDLKADFARIRALGVRCVVCCLDDVELEYLGAPWKEYVAAAGGAGINVLRIPMPEGLTPLSPAALDARLSPILEDYTLRGKPVLVHCRGGVGRAGLVASCWALKLGLCGWLETDPRPVGEGVVRRDTLLLVERVIAVLRARRSAKAIETYEQVKFLVDYVEFLRAQGRSSMGARFASDDAEMEGLGFGMDSVLREKGPI